MNRKMGIFLMVIGFVFVVAGAIVYYNSSEENTFIDRRERNSENGLIDDRKKNGDDFEKFIVQKFDDKYFTIKEWAGDKYVNGKYAQTTTHPDILFQFSLDEKTSDFSVECKWRKRLYKNGVELASPEQFKRYKSYQSNKSIPVFIAIGLGGKGETPEQLFVVPLEVLDTNYVHIDKLRKFEKKVESNFFFDAGSGVLR